MNKEELQEIVQRSLDRERELYGDARLYDHVTGSGSYLDEVVRPQGSQGIVLGLNPPTAPENPDGGYAWWPAATRGHSLCFSSTGGGKNANLLISALVGGYSGSVLVLDPKGENAWISGQRRRELGQRVVILDPWDRVNRAYASRCGEKEEISRFNPLSKLDPRSLEFADDIAIIADGVIYTPERADPHWSESARELLSGLMAASVERAPGVASFRDVRHLLTGSDEALQKVVNEIVGLNPDSLAGRKLRRFVNTKGTNEIASIRSTAETQTAIFDAARLLDSMETGPDAFDLADLARQRVTLYLVLPPEKLQTHGRWMRLIIQLALRAIAAQPTPPQPPVLFMLDELGTINPGAGLRSIEQAFGLLGGAGIRVWAFFQSLSQLRSDYPSSWPTFIENAETIQILRVNENDTAEYFSRHMGVKTVKIEGYHNSQSRPVMMPQEIMRLPRDEILILKSGDNAFRLKTRPYYLEPRLAGMFRPDPNYPPPPVLPKHEPLAAVQAKPAPGAPLASFSPPSWLGKARSALVGGVALGAVFLGGGIVYDQLVLWPREGEQVAQIHRVLDAIVAACRQAAPIYAATHQGQQIPQCVGLPP